MKTDSKVSQNAFSLVEIVLAIVLFGGVSVAIWRLSGTSQRFNTEATSVAQQNAYFTLRAQVTMQGLNPTAVTNLTALILPLTDTPGTLVTPINPATDQRNMGFIRGCIASFEKPALVPAAGANRAQAGSAQRTAINYQAPASGGQTSKGIGLGYSIGSTGVAVPTSTIPLATPTLNYSGDLTSAPFPLNSIITYPSNPPGTTYRFTTDGSMPTPVSPIWNNNPGWTVSSFPQTMTIVAFNTDPQYSPSAPATTTYTYTLSASFSRADGRLDLYDFTYGDLLSPASAGIVLTSSAPGATILFTTDLSDPKFSGAIYTGAFTPDPVSFNPNATLNIIVTSNDPRYVTSPLTTYALTPTTIILPDPDVPTDNSTPLPVGTNVVIDFSYAFGDPRTQLNSDPTDLSSDSLIIPLN
jgi:hypothetical protein